jgi:transcriptional regulator with XRE-family HTH domain
MTPTELRERREALSLTQAQLAERLNVRQPHLSRWERGRKAITHMRAAWLDRELSQLERERAPEELSGTNMAPSG